MWDPPGKDNSAFRLVAVVAAWKAAALSLLVTLFWDSAWASHLVQDIRTWQEFFVSARAGLVPYVHFTKEYPVLGGVLYWAMSPFVDPTDLRGTVVVHGVAMGLADLANVLIFFRIAKEISPRHAVLATVLFALNPTSLIVSPVRFESWVTTCVLLGYLFHRRRRFAMATLFWSIGCGLKWYPAFFIAAQEYRLFVVERRRLHVLVSAGVFLGVMVALNLPFALGSLHVTGSLHNWTYPYLFHAQRPLYWDTLLGVGQIWLGRLSWERHAGLWTLGLMGLVGLVRPRLGVLTKGVLVCLAAVIFNRIYSTQFNLWFYPFLLLTALAREDRARTTLLQAFVLLDVLNILVFPFTFAPAVAEMEGFWPLSARQQGGPWTIVFSLFIALRALLVGALAVYLLREPAPSEVDSPPVPADNP